MTKQVKSIIFEESSRMIKNSSNDNGIDKNYHKNFLKTLLKGGWRGVWLIYFYGLIIILINRKYPMEEMDYTGFLLRFVGGWGLYGIIKICYDFLTYIGIPYPELSIIFCLVEMILLLILGFVIGVIVSFIVQYWRKNMGKYKSIDIK